MGKAEMLVQRTALLAQVRILACASIAKPSAFRTKGMCFLNASALASYVRDKYPMLFDPINTDLHDCKSFLNHTDDAVVAKFVAELHGWFIQSIAN
jgi:hypothetical protein